MWAVITPDGTLTWYPPAATAKVEAIVSGSYAPGATDGCFVYPPLRVLASDVALLAPEHYEPNPVAELVITTLSGGRITQPWRGAVALYECERDTGPGSIGEWIGPMVMTPEFRELIGEVAGVAARAVQNDHGE